ncbi:MAG: peptidylprolyl isomerase [Planctomycetes bacterium]|nr:peptidylprolyl isomerase [Planctomycetota bacterium]
MSTNMGMRTGAAGLVLFIVLGTGGAACSEGPGETVVASVNDRPITLGQLNNMLLRMYGPEVLERLVYREVLKDAMEKANFKAAKEDLELALDEERRNIERTFKGRTTLAEMARRQLGMTEQEYADEVLALRLFLRQQIIGTGEVPEAKLQIYWAKNQEQYRQPPRVRISHILVKAMTERGQENWGAAQKKAESIYGKAVAGEDFARLARETSEDKESAAQGGDLGFSAPETFPWGPGILQVAYELEQGSIAGPIQSMWGYHVIKVTQKIEGSRPEFEKVKDLVRSDYLDEMVRTEADAFTLRLVNAAKVERHLDAALESSHSTAEPETTKPETPGPADKKPGEFFITEE